MVDKKVHLMLTILYSNQLSLHVISLHSRPELYMKLKYR